MTLQERGARATADNAIIFEVYAPTKHLPDRHVLFQTSDQDAAKAFANFLNLAKQEIYAAEEILNLVADSFPEIKPIGFKNSADDSINSDKAILTQFFEIQNRAHQHMHAAQDTQSSANRSLL